MLFIILFDNISLLLLLLLSRESVVGGDVGALVSKM